MEREYKVLEYEDPYGNEVPDGNEVFHHEFSEYEEPPDDCNYEEVDFDNPQPEPEVKKGLVAYVDDDSSLQLPLKTSKNISEMFQDKLGTHTRPRVHQRLLKVRMIQRLRKILRR